MESAEGVLRRPSPHSVAETLDRLEVILKARGIQVFARFDHSGEAARAGLTMPPTLVLVFGHPRAGTPMMLASPTSAIDLPLRVLAAADGSGATWVSYPDPRFFARRFGLTDDQVGPVRAIAELLDLALR